MKHMKVLASMINSFVRYLTKKLQSCYIDSYKNPMDAVCYPNDSRPHYAIIDCSNIPNLIVRHLIVNRKKHLTGLKIGVTLHRLFRR